MLSMRVSSSGLYLRYNLFFSPMYQKNISIIPLTSICGCSIFWMCQKNISRKEESYMRYFIVCAMCGHVGKGKYVEKSFPLVASTGKEAAQACKAIPRVKHDNKRAILSVREVGYEEYRMQQRINEADPYLKAKCRRDYFAAGLGYEDCKMMEDVDGAVGKFKRKNSDISNSKRGRHKAYVNQCNERLDWKEVYNEFGYAM